jgi:Tfp pilus assembly protein PilX
MKSGTGTTWERGIVLVTTLMLMLLMSALLAGFSVAVLSDQQFRGVDKERATAFYASHADRKQTGSEGPRRNFAPTAPR